MVGGIDLLARMGLLSGYNRLKVIRNRLPEEPAIIIWNILEPYAHPVKHGRIADERVRPDHLRSGNHELLFSRFDYQAKLVIEVRHLGAADKGTPKADVLGCSSYRSMRSYQRGWPGNIRSRVSASLTRHEGAPFSSDDVMIETYLVSNGVLPWFQYMFGC